MTLPLFTIPWRQQSDLSSGNASVEYDEKGFKVILDVRQFKPEEIKVKVVDGFIIVEGNHEEHQDNSEMLSRQFVRRYRIPHDVDQRTITSKLSCNGLLEIEALRKVLYLFPLAYE
ncbi:Hsp11 [Gryllus bimaculatus]|nr:Hsp11 [Gryllus bimaculatus]